MNLWCAKLILIEKIYKYILFLTWKVMNNCNILLFLKDLSDLSDNSVSTPIATRTKQLPHLKFSSTSDESKSDPLSRKKVNGTKR